MAVRPCPDDKGVARRGAPSPAKIAILSLEVLDPLGRLIAPDPDPAFPGRLERALVVPGSASAPRGTAFALTGARAFIWLHPLRSAGARGDRPEGSRLEGSSSRRGRALVHQRVETAARSDRGNASPQPAAFIGTGVPGGLRLRDAHAPCRAEGSAWARSASDGLLEGTRVLMCVGSRCVGLTGWVGGV